MLPTPNHDNEEFDNKSGTKIGVTEFAWPAKPRYKLTGLQNQGGTCYLNTLLQTLLHTPEFTYRLFKLTHSTKRENLKKMIQEMLNLFASLITNGGGAISSKPLTDSFGWTEEEVCVHQDIQELNRLLFEQIEIALKGTDETNLINDLFRGVQCTRIRCLQCGRTSERNDEFQDINLSVMDHDSVEESLAAHTQMERLTGENQYFCEECRCKVDAIKMTRFEELPPILTLSLSRFYFDSKLMQSVKLEKRCSFPFMLDMSGYFMGKTHKTAKYDLFSVVLHVGGNTGGGHYHAFIKDPYGTISGTINDGTSACELNGSNKCHVQTGSSMVQRTAKNGLGNKNYHTQLPEARLPQPYANDYPPTRTSSMDFGIIGSELESKTSVCGHTTGSVVLQHSSANIHKSSSDVFAGALVPKNLKVVNWKQKPGSLLSPPAMRPLFHSDTARISGVVFANRSKLRDLRIHVGHRSERDMRIILVGLNQSM
ncbi:hypothetical protein CRM22_002853 [Opisthorchis felineus]|uniref:USP domain-containing protein n=1 Tax=Opisthorchis felineus TaxID=147828 RepID=A0A4S2M4L1_OPIFE|nr:hypothetical protein CRM22_002853 [Opisthorchis felineus]